MALEIDHRRLTNKELTEECLLWGSDVEKRLANYIFHLQNEITALEDRIEYLEEMRWAS